MPMDTIHIDSKGVLMVAHRGVSGLERENTASAFIAAGNRSYWGIETDVHRTLDGRFVCIHDGETGRVGIDNMKVETTTYETLRSLILKDMDGTRGRFDLHIPSLKEYVAICKKYGKTGVLELKSEFTGEELEKIVDIIRGEDYLHGIVFIAFNIRNLIGVRRILPDQPCQYLRSEFDGGLIDTLKEHRLDLDLDHGALTKEILDELHKNGVTVNVWTVDRAEDAEKYIGWGVDMITSNILE